jgi:serine/threonine protein kinase
MSTREPPSPDLDDPRVVAALEQYLAAIEAGERPNRQAFLARHAEVAEALAECLDGMEALHEAASSALAPTGPPVATDTPAEWQPELPLGDFRIVREVGRGGMGVVYEAVQLSLGRRVALKVLPLAAALDARQLQRFRNEAQAAAHLHHTNIVPVYAVGCERGVHFYAMQLIEGQNLAALIERLRGDHGAKRELARGSPANGTAAAQASTQDSSGSLRALRSSILQPRIDFFRTAARLGAQAAEGLDYAHGMGIIHRDIKPANLLVDDRGNVWITDFGLARLHDDGGLTQTGDLLGTLRYMSPEQAGGPRVLIDHRTDVYSLGATLYELLTLRPIFDGTDRQTLLHQILHQEPRPPRAIDRAIPPELETIVLKAVAKSPAERYATARDLAEDLHRFLRHEPVRARRPTLLQRARKWGRRHPSVLAAAVGLLALLTAGSLLSAWLIRGEQEKTRLAYERERQRAAEAEERFRLARRSVDEMIQMAEEDLADKPHMAGLRRRLLEAALIYYQEFIEQRRDDPNAQAELAATQARVRKILDDLAVLQGAGQLYLLGNPAVLDDLQLSDEQRAKIAELSRRLGEQRMEAFREFHRQTPEERRRNFLELARANDAAVAAILLPEQRRRLQQIALQLQGPSAFREVDVAAALKLTAEQKERVRVIEAEMLFGKPDRPRGPWQDYEQRLKTAREAIQALLTDEQAKRWREMAGKPFKGSVPLFMPPPGPFGPPR